MDMKDSHALRGAAAVSLLVALAGCGGDDDDVTLPQLPAATGAALTSCTNLTTKLSFANTSSARRTTSPPAR
jgi:hypothetical protein